MYWRGAGEKTGYLKWCGESTFVKARYSDGQEHSSQKVFQISCWGGTGFESPVTHWQCTLRCFLRYLGNKNSTIVSAPQEHLWEFLEVVGKNDCDGPQLVVATIVS